MAVRFQAISEWSKSRVAEQIPKDSNCPRMGGTGISMIHKRLKMNQDLRIIREVKNNFIFSKSVL